MDPGGGRNFEKFDLHALGIALLMVVVNLTKDSHSENTRGRNFEKFDLHSLGIASLIAGL